MWDLLFFLLKYLINLATILTIINLAKCIDHHIYLAQQHIHSFDCIAALQFNYLTFKT